jgi:hypothetical protein
VVSSLAGSAFYECVDFVMLFSPEVTLFYRSTIGGGSRTRLPVRADDLNFMMLHIDHEFGKETMYSAHP